MFFFRSCPLLCLHRLRTALFVSVLNKLCFAQVRGARPRGCQLLLEARRQSRAIPRRELSAARTMLPSLLIKKPSRADDANTRRALLMIRFRNASGVSRKNTPDAARPFAGFRREVFLSVAGPASSVALTVMNEGHQSASFVLL